MAKTAILVKWLIDHEDKMAIQKVTSVIPPKEEKDNLEFFYKHLECDMIDIVYADNFEMVVDDEGLLKSGNAVAEYELARGTKISLAGNIMFIKPCDSEGRTVWLDDEIDTDLIPEIEAMIRNSELKGVTQ